MAELLFFRDGELQLRAPLKSPSLVLGRGAEADLVLPDRAVSRLQCEIVRRNTGFAVIDRSGRGTAVSQRTAGDHGTLLKDGDQIRLGAFLAVFSETDHVEAPPEVTAPRKDKRGRTGPLAPGPSIERLRARLRVRGPEGETVIPLRAEEGFALVVGTDPEGPVQLALKDTFVSGEHCRLSFRNGTWLVRDLDSKNGTHLEGARIIEGILMPRSAIRVGETTLHFEQDLAPSWRAEEPLPGLVTRDPAMAPVIELVRRVAGNRAAVAIHGETGSGKEVIARACHLLSERRDGPFIALNCGALPRETVESELFGHDKGAFTGADKARAGAFEEADGGTLFLDEIGDLPLNVQVKLLRTLERGEVRRLGSNRIDTVDVRIVSATHRDLGAMVEDGSFREDLFYRLCVVPLELPPLRQRTTDIVPLAEHFAAELTPGQTRPVFSPSARAKLEGHTWPGNARELRNVVQVALLQRRGPVIADEDLVIRSAAARRRKGADTLRVAGLTMDEIEREAYRLALDRHQGDRKAAMSELGVAKSTFFRKIEEFGLGRDD